MNVRLIAKTVASEELLKETIQNQLGPQEVTSYITRVSNPSNQGNFDTASKLLGYCIKHKHWSPFEHASFTFEITTSRAIAAQILRHRSFVFQEFSQRYAEVPDDSVVYYEARRQDIKNRQNSLDDMSLDERIWFRGIQEHIWKEGRKAYNEAISKGIAKEQARFLLPLNTQTTLYMTGNIRSWIHYVELRADKATQLEHREIAESIKKLLIKEIPDVAVALKWTNE